MLRQNCNLSEIEVCRTCLAADVKLHSLQNGTLKLYIESIITNRSTKSLPQFLCYLCAKQLEKCYTFLQMCITAQTTLEKLLDQNIEITTDIIKENNQNSIHKLSLINVSYRKVFEYIYNNDKGKSYLMKCKTDSNKRKLLNENDIIVTVKEEQYIEGPEDSKTEIKLESDKEINKKDEKLYKNIDEECIVQDKKNLLTSDNNNRFKKTKAKTNGCNKNRRTLASYVKGVNNDDKSSTDDISTSESELDSDNLNLESKKLIKQAEIIKRRVTKKSNERKRKRKNTIEQFEGDESKIEEHFDNSILNISKCNQQFVKKKQCDPEGKDKETSEITSAIDPGFIKGDVITLDGKEYYFCGRMSRKKAGTVKKRKEKLRCQKCMKTFANFEAMLLHKIKVHKIVPRCLRPKAEPSPFPKKCDYCDVILSSRREDWCHMRKRHRSELSSYKNVVNTICDTCGRGFHHATNLRRHELRHKPPSVRCPKCPRLFYDNARLKSHMPVHENTRPYQCSHCGMAFNCQSNLYRHSRIHSKETPYKCEICGRGFKQRDSYRSHVKHVHMNVPYPKRDRTRTKTMRKNEKTDT